MIFIMIIISTLSQYCKHPNKIKGITQWSSWILDVMKSINVLLLLPDRLCPLGGAVESYFVVRSHTVKVRGPWNHQNSSTSHFCQYSEDNKIKKSAQI